MGGVGPDVVFPRVGGVLKVCDEALLKLGKGITHIFRARADEARAVGEIAIDRGHAHPCLRSHLFQSDIIAVGTKKLARRGNNGGAAVKGICAHGILFSTPPAKR